jgi:saccharopine dehydrogenase-like NADP-dependent oxidoreductase
MKKILVLGAGLVARPLVNYLLDQAAMTVTVADQVFEKARALVVNHPSGTALELDINNQTLLKETVSRADIVISLLPWVFHPKIAELCLEYGKHLVTASYVKDEMRAMDAAAKEKGLIFLNEIGVDPGVDHMSAMQVINRIKDAGGTIVGFHSYCGGLPAQENNNNPLGYKFSWSPEGAMLAATNDGRYMKDGQVIEVPGNQLFEHYWLVDIPGAGAFEAYVNRDAIPYREIYGIESTANMCRGTLRNIGYCETWDFLKKLGMLNRNMKFDFSEVTPRQVIADIINSTGENLKKEVAAYLKIPEFALTIKKLDWLGLFDDKKLDIGTCSVFDMFAHTLQNKLIYLEGEKDLLIQHHEFTAEYPDHKKEKVTATLINMGIPGGDTSMSRTVGLPVAIATKLIAEGKIDLTGVHIPVVPEIYEPVLAELKTLNIAFTERKTELTDSANTV